MKNLLIIIFCLWLVGCETREERKERNEKESPELVFHETYLGRRITRLENSEVVCYHEIDGSMQCKFKENK